MTNMIQIAESVRKGDVLKVQELVQAALFAGDHANEILEKGLFAGMTVVGELFKEEEIFIPEVIIAAKAMQAGVDLLGPLLSCGAKKTNIGKVILGTVKGDLHDLGKNLVRLMLRGAGFEVIDLGVNVPADKFISMTVEHGATIIAMSALLTTTMPYMKSVIEAIKASGLEGQVKTLVGGACVTEKFAESIGADGYGQNAIFAVEKARQLIAL